jgi:hypothetical protein
MTIQLDHESFTMPDNARELSRAENMVLDGIRELKSIDAQMEQLAARRAQVQGVVDTNRAILAPYEPLYTE